MLQGPPALARLVYEALKRFADPQQILANSLVLYRRYGDAEPLVVGAGLLEDLGAMSWPVLAAFARTMRPECAYFVPAIGRLNDVDAKERLEILAILARSGDPELRWRIYEVVDEFPVDEAVPVLKSLAASVDRDDDVRIAAEERLRSVVENPII